MDVLFAKVLVINMDGDDERLAGVANRLRRTGTDYFERVQAVDGRLLTDRDKGKCCTAYCRAMCTPSMIGCFLSHRKCWQKCVDEGLSSVLICEDDVVFTDGATEITQMAVQELPPGWDMLYLGCFTCGVDDITTEDAGITKVMYPHRTATQVSEHLWRPAIIFGMHAYAVSQQGARQLLSLMPYASNHVDWAVSKHIDEMDMLALRPGVAFQTGMDTSSMGSKAPVFLNKFLSRIPLGTHDQDGRTFAWQFSEAWLKLGWNCVIVNKWFMIFFLLSLFGYQKAACTIILADCLLALATGSELSKSFILSYLSLVVSVVLGTNSASAARYAGVMV